MRSYTHALRCRALLRTSAFISLATLLGACSNDALRFEEALTTGSVVKSPAQQSQYQRPASDQITTGSVRSTSRNGIRVSRSAPSKIVSSPLPVAEVNENLAVAKPARVAVAAPQPVAVNTPKGVVLKERSAQKPQLKTIETDPITTSSVSKVVTTKRTPDARTGWTETGGTWVTVDEGVTLYNLSKRYGVPVSAIMKSNNISDPAAVKSGSRIIIPTYVYSRRAAVSAPDNNPKTLASRSSKGLVSHPRAGSRIAVPVHRAAEQVPVKKSAKVREIVPAKRPEPGQKSEQAKKPEVSNRPATVLPSAHVVASGDTLYKISKRYNVKLNTIRSLNGLKSDTLSLGQTVKLPADGAGQNNGAATTTIADANTIDKTVTGSIPKTADKPIVRQIGGTKTAKLSSKDSQRGTDAKPEKSAKTSAFHWPARGRVVAKFGERVNGRGNDGIDISVPEGTPVSATQNGTVIYSGSELEDFGNLILVSHSDGWVSAYAHASKTLVKRGQKVRRGQVIAKSGRTGNAAVPKLHFELRKNSNPVNPLTYLK